MSGEEWRALPGHEWGYEVSNLGRVRSIDRLDSRGRLVKGRALKPCPTVSGYLEVFPCRGGVSRPVLIHRAVLEAFVGACPDGMEGCHDNGDNADNRLENLRWDTRRNNHADKSRHGTDAKGEKNTQAKLTPCQVVAMRQLRASGLQLKDIGGRFGISSSHTSNIVRGKAWPHI